MFVGKVIGNVWGTRKHPSLEGGRLLLVRPIDPISGESLGDAVMALDGGVQAGPGSVVLVVDEGGSARGIIGDPKAPVRTVICAVVDNINRGSEETRYA